MVGGLRPVGQPRDFPVSYPGGNGFMTRGFCVNFCKNLNYAYAAVQYGYNCFCGNKYGSWLRKLYWWFIKMRRNEMLKSSACGNAYVNQVLITGAPHPPPTTSISSTAASSSTAILSSGTTTS